jgi:hypothetical protein
MWGQPPSDVRRAQLGFPWGVFGTKPRGLRPPDSRGRLSPHRPRSVTPPTASESLSPASATRRRISDTPETTGSTPVLCRPTDACAGSYPAHAPGSAGWHLRSVLPARYWDRNGTCSHCSAALRSIEQCCCSAQSRRIPPHSFCGGPETAGSTPDSRCCPDSNVALFCNLCESLGFFPVKGFVLENNDIQHITNTCRGGLLVAE